MKVLVVDFGFDTGFKKSAFLPGNFFQLLFEISINSTETARFSQYRVQNRSPSLPGQRRFVDEERVKLNAECDKQVAEARASMGMRYQVKNGQAGHECSGTQGT
jgi:hypothetical protein